MTMQSINIPKILDNPYQPRTTDNAEHIENLARSIAADGLLQTPKARALTDGTYQLAFGHSRRKAFEWLNTHWQDQGLPDRYNGYFSMPVDVVELTDEEMYRYAVTENVQRKDLDPIELAKSMTVYRDLFGKSSDEIGALFGMNGATVRGKLRLLDLPEEAKTELSSGGISESAAREILSLQKVASADVIHKAIEQIKNGVDRWGTETTPKEIVEDIIDELDNVEALTWQQDDDKKPVVKGNGWALDMKKFPNHYLPLLTGHVAVQTLDCFDDKPAQELILQIAEYLDADTAPNTGNKEIDADFHKANQNQIQTRMDKLAEINPEYSQRLSHLINPPACSACPFMTKFDGKYYCGIKTCYTRKVSAWQRHGLQAASKKLGFDIYNAESDGDYLVLEDTYHNNEHAELWRKKNKDLRLVFMADIDRKKYQSGYDGCPDGCVVMVVGKTMQKLQEKKEQAREEKRFNIEELRSEKMSERINELLWESTAYLKSMLDGLTDDAVFSLYDAPRYGWSGHSAIPDSDDQSAEHSRREITLFMLISGDDSSIRDDDEYETLADLVTDIQKRAKVWKIKVPAELAKKAAKYDQEIAEAVAAETAERKGKTK